MRGSAVFRTGVAPGGALAGPWVKNQLWTRARAVPSLDLRFADNKSLVDATTGSNLVTFTRASSGTFVGSDGVLQTAVTNLLLRSEEFDNASWTKNNLQAFGSGSISNALAAPNETLTADYLAENTTLNEHLVEQSFASVSGFTYTYSVYVKAGPNKTNVVLRFTTASWGGGSSNQIRFNLISGAVAVVSGTGTGMATQLPNGWWRLAITSTATASGSSAARVQFLENNGTSVNYTGDGVSGYYLWGAQLEQSSTVGEYIPTTSTINSAPRFDHNPTTGESLGLLVEEQRTNLLSASEAMDTAPWGLAAATAVANNGVAPDGATTADKIISTGGGCFRAGVGVVNATAYTYSVFLKHIAGTGVTSAVGFERFGSTMLAGNSSFNLLTGTVVFNGASVQSSSITRYPNNWFRVSITATSTDVTTTVVNYTSTSGNEFLIWGAQLEAGAFPTSYIPTTTAAATRSADVASITGSAFSGWYRQNEGTVFVDVNSAPVNNIVQLSYDVSDGTSNERFFQRRTTSGTIQTAVVDGGVIQRDIGGISLAASARYKTGFAYKLNDLELLLNGGGSSLGASATIPTVNQLYIGQSFAAVQQVNGTIRRLAFWGQRLPNNVLQQITQ